MSYKILDLSGLTEQEYTEANEEFRGVVIPLSNIDSELSVLLEDKLALANNSDKFATIAKNFDFIFLPFDIDCNSWFPFLFMLQFQILSYQFETGTKIIVAERICKSYGIK